MAFWKRVGEAFLAIVTVGRHRRLDKTPVQQDGFITAILLLVLFFGVSVAILMTQYLSADRLAYEDGETTFRFISPIFTEVFLILLLLPGYATIIYAFNKRGLSIKNLFLHNDVDMYEFVELLGLYFFGVCSVSFDIISIIMEIGCSHASTDADNIVDCVFFIFKLFFTLCQCLFIRRFYKSHFDSKPLLQISLVSIITANMAIWLYTTIEDDALDLFSPVWLKPKAYMLKVQPQLQGFCADLGRDQYNSVEPYFAPFSLEFSLLVFERIIIMWGSMTDLDCPRNVPIQRAPLNNNELHSLQNELEEQKLEHSLYRDDLSASLLRAWSWITSLYNPPFPNQNELMDTCDAYVLSLERQINTVDTTLDDNHYVLTRLKRLLQINIAYERLPQGQGQVNFPARLRIPWDAQRHRLERQRESIHTEINGKLASLREASNQITRERENLTQNRVRLFRQNTSCKACGLWCTIGLFAGILLLTTGLVFLLTHGSEDLTTFNSTHTYNLTECINRDTQVPEPTKKAKEILDFLTAVDCISFAFNLLHIGIIIYGFFVLTTFQSDYTSYDFNDIFYCLSCSGSVIFLSFSIIANFSTVKGTTVRDWHYLSNTTTATDGKAIPMNTTLSGDPQCASQRVSDFSNFNAIYEFSQLAQILMSSSFVLHASRLLPHGRIQDNHPVSEVLQFLGVTHFFLWAINSFIYGPNTSQFFYVETFYYGKSAFKVIARLTFPVIVFYHFTTALRCLKLFHRYESKP